MKKGTLLTLLLAGVMGLSTLTLAGCGGGGGGGNNNGGDNNGGGSQQPGPVTPTPSNPVLQTAANSFTGAKATYAKTRYLNAAGDETTFENLLDTQIDVLAQDLLYRLAYVYGSNESGVTNRSTTFDSESNKAEANLHNLKLPDGVTDYKYGSNTASISNKAVVTNYNGEVLKTDSFKTIDIDDSSVLSELAKSLLIIETDSTQNYLQRKNALNFVGAISGFNMKITEDLDVKFLDEDNTKSWAVTKYNLFESSTLMGLQSIKADVKLAIAQILANDTTTNSYQTLLTKVNNLGCLSLHKSQIVDYIYNNIIGSELVTKDNSYAQYFKDNHAGVINATSIVAVNNNTSLDDDSKDFDATNNPRLYKGYSIVIPAIVEQALNNTFDGTTTSIYPKMTRTAVKTTNSAAGFTEELPYETLTIKPKTGAKATKLSVSFQGVGESIGKTISINYVVQIGTKTASSTKQVTLSSTATEVEFDLHSLMNSAAFSAYNGRDYAVTDGVAFQTEGEFTNGELTNTDGTSYIKLNISGLNGKSMKVTLNGLYDKV